MADHPILNMTRDEIIRTYMDGEHFERGGRGVILALLDDRDRERARRQEAEAQRDRWERYSAELMALAVTDDIEVALGWVRALMLARDALRERLAVVGQGMTTEVLRRGRAEVALAKAREALRQFLREHSAAYAGADVPLTTVGTAMADEVLRLADTDPLNHPARDPEERR